MQLQIGLLWEMRKIPRPLLLEIKTVVIFKKLLFTKRVPMSQQRPLILINGNLKSVYNEITCCRLHSQTSFDCCDDSKQCSVITVIICILTNVIQGVEWRTLLFAVKNWTNFNRWRCVGSKINKLWNKLVNKVLHFKVTFPLFQFLCLQTSYCMLYQNFFISIQFLKCSCEVKTKFTTSEVKSLSCFKRRATTRQRFTQLRAFTQFMRHTKAQTIVFRDLVEQWLLLCVSSV